MSNIRNYNWIGLVITSLIFYPLFLLISKEERT